MKKRPKINVVKCNLGWVNLEKMSLVVSMICGVTARACLTMSLHVSPRHHTCSCLLRWSLWITTLDGSLFWSPYEQFACSVELCGSLLWLSILPIQYPALPTPHRKWFMVGNGSDKLLHWISFRVTVLGNDRLQGSQGCHGTSLLRLVF